MAEAGFPKPVAEVIATLIEIFRHQQKPEIVELLESSNAYFQDIHYDNWNGGTTTWALRLESPIPVFASVEPRLAATEKEIASKLSYFDRFYPNDPIGEVTVLPIAHGTNVTSQRIAPSEIDVRRLWPERRFRLFLSHVAKHKVPVSELKDELELRGVEAFVAHEAIKPSLEWQREIELALRSMHALVPLITPDFHASPWTDQEVGWAFGRGLLVIPVRLGTDPYGFAGKVQGITGDLSNPKDLAVSIVKALLTNSQTHGEMRRALVTAFSKAYSYPMALALRDHIVEVEDFTDEEKESLRVACEDNDQVSGAFNVPEAIYEAFGKPPPKKQIQIQEGDDVPF